MSKQYRPVLSGGMIDHIINLCKKENPISSESISIIGKLAPFQAKIHNDAKAEAYTIQPAKQSIEQSIGLDLGIPAPARVPKEEYWELCYRKYDASPEQCTIAEIQGAREYKYLNGLMSKEEIAEFEA